MTSKVEISEATLDDLVDYFGAVPEEDTHALVAKLDGRIIAVSGAYWYETGAVAFADFTPTMLKRKKDVVKGSKIVLRYLEKLGFSRVFAVADTQISGARHFLDRLGFQPTGQMTEVGEYLVKEL